MSIKKYLTRKNYLYILGFFVYLLIVVNISLKLNIIFFPNTAKHQNINIDNITPDSPTPTISLTPTKIPTLTPTPQPQAKIIFGIGSQAGPAMDYKLVKESPIKMLTSWYNGTSDLEWMRIQQNDLIPRLYKNKYIVHLITWTGYEEHGIQTRFGLACGRPYPVSDQVVEDMKELSQIYNGSGPMYVSLFTEFPTFTCTDNNWVGNENYWNSLKENYRKIKDNFHTYAPNSKVSISWGGWLALYDDQSAGGGRSLIPHFADIIKESDFSSFQAMESFSNIEEIRTMTKILGAYGKPVMLAHYKPSNASPAVFNADLNTIFTDSIMSELTRNGLFAMSFMDDEIINDSEEAYQTAKGVITKYAN